MNTPFLAWALGGPEMIAILVVILLLFGAKKLPELARGMGKSIGEFKKAKGEFEDEITRVSNDDNDRKG
jgi:sec-independent protein translocase protein TatA